MGGRGAGRSRAAAGAAIHWGSHCRMKFLCLRQYQNSIEESSKAELEGLIEESGDSNSWKITRNNIFHKRTGTKFLFKGIARNISSLKSIPEIDVVWIEECEDVTTRALINTIMPTVRKESAELWATGNFRHRTDAIPAHFFEQEPPPLTEIMRTCYLENPHISNRFIEEAEHLKRVNPLLYNHVYMGQYLDMGSMKMVMSCTIDNGTAKRYDSDICVFGVDIARDGDDDTCICVRKGRRVAHIEEHQNMDLTKLTERLRSLAIMYPPDHINVDTTGHGAWCGDGLRLSGIKVHDINFSEKPTHPSTCLKFPNKRTEMYDLCNEYFMGGGTIPKSETKLKEELESSWYTLDSMNRKKMILKEKIKEMIGRSPDRSDAFALSMMTHGDDMFSKLKGSANDDLVKKALSSLGNAGKWG